MIAEIVISLLASLMLTVAAELAAAWLLKVRKPAELLFVVLANCITNPVVNACYYLLLSRTEDVFIQVAALVFLEIAVVAAEYLYFKITLKGHGVNKLLLSVVLNASSFFAGIIVSILLMLL